MVDLNLGYTRMIIRECEANNLKIPTTAYILATAYWETARTMRPVKEAYWLSEAWRARNLRYYPWYGRGFVQLTWKYNYEKAGKILKLDLTTNPDRVMEPAISAAILVKGSVEGWFTGRKLSDYIGDNKLDYVSARRVINGTDKAFEIAKIALEYKKALEAEASKEPKKSSTWNSFIESFTQWRNTSQPKK
jgi:hypothetical protein